MMEHEVCAGDVGEVVSFGRWQLQIFAFFVAAAFFSTWENVALPFLAYPTPFSCADSDYDRLTDQCFLNGSSRSACTHFVYDTSFFKRSMISEWDLVCSRSWMPAFSQTAYMLGMLFASLCAGYTADRFGRKPVIMLGFCLEILAGFYSAYAPGIIHFFASRFLIAFGQTARYITGLILGMSCFACFYAASDHRLAMAIETVMEISPADRRSGTSVSLFRTRAVVRRTFPVIKGVCLVYSRRPLVPS